MDRTSRKAAKTAAIKTPPEAGIFAVHVGDRAWVGATMRLDAAERRLTFMLRTGGVTTPALKEAYAATGTARFEVLERLEEDIGQMTRERLLKERSDHWRQRLGAAQF